MYKNGNSQDEIASKYNVTQNAIYKILKKCNIKCRPKKASIKFNEHFFDRVDNEIKAYWLGFIVADGCVQMPGNRQNMLSIGLSVKDSKHLSNFITDIESEHNLYFYKSKDSKGNFHESVRITLSSNILVNSLLKLGIGPRKTNTVLFPNISNDLTHHFMRGYFDGDGSVYLKSIDKRANRKIRQLRVVIVGNNKFIDKYRNILSELSGIKLPSVTNKTVLYRIDMQGNKQAKKIYDFLYKSATRYLDRKKSIFIKNI